MSWSNKKISHQLLQSTSHLQSSKRFRKDPHPHFTKEESEAFRGKEIFPKTQNRSAAELITQPKVSKRITTCKDEGGPHKGLLELIKLRLERE